MADGMDGGELTALRSVCGLFDCSDCARVRAGMCKGCIATNLALRRQKRPYCAVYQCVKEHRVDSCLMCQEPDCRWRDDGGCPGPLGPDEAAEAARQEHIARFLEWRRVSARPGALSLPEKAVSRMRYYLSALAEFREHGLKVVSSYDLGRRVGVSSALVRRDLARLGNLGKPSQGYEIDDLASGMRKVLGLDVPRPVAWAGVRPLLFYSGVGRQFAEHNCEIILLFDADPGLVGQQVGDHEVLPLAQIRQEVAARRVRLGVIALADPEQAQQAADSLSAGGVNALLNLSSGPVSVPPGVFVQAGDLGTQLFMLVSYSRGRRPRRRPAGRRARSPAAE